MQKLVDEAVTTNADTPDPDTLDKQVQLYRSAVQIGISYLSTAAKHGKHFFDTLVSQSGSRTDNG
jgi:hypothetical protein